ncbi:probable transcription factor At4g00610 [Arabidopsis lyrata subsp. lyrata]|uniref:probable transcription factor At4g00610 n=1 Tax=Arabidopsis lyrata subsp. lyrata TaxID=81972 RepID=UPI000A29E9B8|nr:probable transcription factor At4g00610 [Arabidopsis lyrata subsp. lyrata]|eukprot:XP_020880771.1 probable transcription factor At4g00610 [Arabidopsis lyrata subsp. lyrata]
MTKKQSQPSKREIEEDPSTEVEVKRAKMENGPETENKPIFQRIKTATKTTPPAAMAKNPMFQRSWSEEDQIMLLEGMIDFSRDTGTSVYDDMNGFSEKHKDSISFDVKNVNQFVKKIWSLKNKYFLKRRSRVSTNVHDKNCLELAKKIWGSDVDATLKVDDSFKVDGVKVECDWFERSFLVGALKNLGAGIDEETLKEKWSLAPLKTRKRIEEKMKSVQANELKLVLRKLDVLHEVSSLLAKSLSFLCAGGENVV